MEIHNLPVEVLFQIFSKMDCDSSGLIEFSRTSIWAVDLVRQYVKKNFEKLVIFVEFIK